MTVEIDRTRPKRGWGSQGREFQFEEVQMREGKGVHCQKVCLINVPLQGGPTGGEEEGAPFSKHAKEEE